LNSIGEMLSQSEILNFKWIDFRGPVIYVCILYIRFQSPKSEKNALHKLNFYFLW
jgi:hypothetical protein